MTLNQLKKFIKYRNQSEFDSNLSFMFDCDRAGFKHGELGQAKHLPHAKKIGNQYWSFYWDFPFGILVEHFGKMRLFRRNNHENRRHS